MGLERNLGTLTSLGLTRTEAEIYVFLTQNGTQEWDVLAREFNISNQQLSRNLSELLEKGFINTETKRSNTFSALPLERVLENIVDSKLREAKKVMEEKEEFLKLKRTQTKACAKSKTVFQIGGEGEVIKE